MQKFPLLPFSCVEEAILITLGEKKNLPCMCNKTDKTAPYCKCPPLPVILPVFFSLGKHKLSGDTCRAPPALEQLLAPQCLNILNFYVVLKQLFRVERAGGESLGCSWHCCFGQFMCTGSLSCCAKMLLKHASGFYVC